MPLSINLDLGYFAHPKTVRLVGLLGKGAELLPIRLWTYVGKYHAESGRVTGYSTQAIETAVAWWGKPGRAVEALVTSGFLERVGLDDYLVHDWLDYQQHLANYRTRGKKAETARWKPRNKRAAPTGSGTNALSIATALYSIEERGAGRKSVDNSDQQLRPEEAKKLLAELCLQIEERKRLRIKPISVLTRREVKKAKNE